MKKIISKILCLTLSVLMLVTVCNLTAFAREVDTESPLYGLKVGFFGDSICAANVEKEDPVYSEMRGWAGRIGTYNGMVWDNNGVSGASISTCRDTNTVVSQLRPTVAKRYDIVMLQGGVNDAWDSAPVGQMTEGTEGNVYDVSTFAGGLEDLFERTKTYFPKAKIGYIINYKFTSAGVESLNNMDEYVEMTKKICDKWGVKYVDLYSNEELTAQIQPDTQTNLYDYIHASSEGYDIIYPIIEDFMKQLVTGTLDSADTTDTSAQDTESLAPDTDDDTTADTVDTTEPEDSTADTASEDTDILTDPDTDKKVDTSSTSSDSEPEANNDIIIYVIAGVAVIAIVVVLVVVLRKKK